MQFLSSRGDVDEGITPFLWKEKRVQMNSVKDTYNQIAASYDTRYKDTIHFVEEEIIAGHIPNIADNQKVLDIGCGTGNMITVGQIKPDQYTGIDISDNMLQQAEKKYPDYTFAYHDARKPLIGNFDVILSIFGQANYMGIYDWVESIELNLAKGGAFLSVMYSDNYKPEYLNGEATLYDIDSVHMAISQSPLDYKIKGLTFPMPNAYQYLEFDMLYQIQNNMTESGDLEKCKYWIIKGVLI